jgi:RHS repeat-associated protein
LQSLTHKKNATTYAGYGFTYDDANRLTGFTSSQRTAESATYTYDPRGQLTIVDRSGYTNDKVYYYDDNGNRQEYEIVVDPNNRLQRDDFAGYSYDYDAEGNRTRQSGYESYTTYEWDHRNRLVSAIDYDENGTPFNDSDDFVTNRVDYVYDAFDQLVKRKVDGDGNPATTADVDQAFYLWDDGQIVLEFHKEGSGSVAASDLEHRYLWNPAAVDQLLADEQVESLTNASLNETLWGLPDHLGSVRDVVDDAGTLRIHKDFNSFGNVIDEDHFNASGSAVTASQTGYVQLAFGFTGALFDAALSLQYNRARWYDAKVGRWINEDPIGFAGTDANLYRYVGNSPTMYTDPSGLVEIIEVPGGGRIKRFPDGKPWRTLRQALSLSCVCLSELPVGSASRRN